MRPGTKVLYQEDINDLFEALMESHVLSACNLTDEDEDMIFDILERHLDKFSHGYRNYN